MQHVAKAAKEVGFQPENIMIAQSASSARELIQQCLAGKLTHPDIAVVDPHLTHNVRLEDGFDVMEELKAMAPDCKVIVLTVRGDTKNSLGSRGMSRGANDYIDMQWRDINWYEFLKYRLDLWRGVVQSAA